MVKNFSIRLIYSQGTRRLSGNDEDLRHDEDTNSNRILPTVASEIRVLRYETFSPINASTLNPVFHSNELSIKGCSLKKKKKKSRDIFNLRRLY